jgi:beta-lactamase regulating signal transducer with metallopeptidase domain
MEAEFVALIVRLNCVLAGAILLVLALRSPARRCFGARIAYALWLAPPLAAAASLLPARVIHVTLPTTFSSAPAVAPADHSLWYVIAWCLGVFASLAILALRQFRFARALGGLRPRGDCGPRVFSAATRSLGPAVVGVLRPIIVTPADFDQRFNDEERRAVIAHERAHLAHGDPLINAFVVLLQCLNWFNPLVHVASAALRIDQELACDAAVLAGARRRTYAEAILKTQIAACAPLGCAWPSPSPAALKERIAMLKQDLPSRTQRLLGASAIALITLSVGAAAWSAQPARIIANVEPAAVAAPAPTSKLTIAVAATPVASAATPKVNTLALAGDDDDTDVGGNVVRIVSVEDLTPEQREHIRAEIARAMEEQREALAESRAALNEARRELEAHRADLDGAPEREAEARAALQEAQQALAEHRAEIIAAPERRAEARAAIQEAQRAIEAHRAELAVVQSPEMRAEVRALVRDAARLAEATHLSETERAQIRAEMQENARAVRESAVATARRAEALELAREQDAERESAQQDHGR